MITRTGTSHYEAHGVATVAAMFVPGGYAALVLNGTLRDSIRVDGVHTLPTTALAAAHQAADEAGL